MYYECMCIASLINYAVTGNATNALHMPDYELVVVVHIVTFALHLGLCSPNGYSISQVIWRLQGLIPVRDSEFYWDQASYTNTLIKDSWRIKLPDVFKHLKITSSRLKPIGQQKWSINTFIGLISRSRSFSSITDRIGASSVSFKYSAPGPRLKLRTIEIRS